MGDFDGTVTSKLRPIVTTLTEALVEDFTPVYEYLPEVSRVAGGPKWERSDGGHRRVIVGEEDLWNDVKAWLLHLEEDMQEETDKKYAAMILHMVSKNPGWITLLTNRVKKALLP